MTPASLPRVGMEAGWRRRVTGSVYDSPARRGTLVIDLGLGIFQCRFNSGGNSRNWSSLHFASGLRHRPHCQARISYLFYVVVPFALGDEANQDFSLPLLVADIE